MQARPGGRAEEDFIEVGLADQAKQGLALVSEADQVAPEGQAGDEGPRAVDGVEDPDELGIGTVFAVLLADHAVIGVAGGDQATDFSLRAAVSGGHRVIGCALVRLVLHADAGAEQGQGHASRGAIELEQKGFELGETGGGRRI